MNQIENSIATSFPSHEITPIMPEIMPIMLKLYLMLLLTYYAKNYARPA